MILVLVVKRCHPGNGLFTDYGKRNNRTLVQVKINKQPHRKRTKYPQVESEIPSCLNSKTKHQGSQNEAPSIPVKPPTNNLPKSVNFKCYFPVLPSSTHEKEKKKKEERRRKCNQRSGFFSFTRKEENERRIVIKERMIAG